MILNEPLQKLHVIYTTAVGLLSNINECDSTRGTTTLGEQQY